MEKSFNYNPKVYTLSALIIGYLMIGDYTAYQQNAFGNWLMTVGQILECNSAIEQALQEYNGNNNNQTELIHLISKNKKEIDDIKDMLNNMINKINNLKK